jgi:acyl carrier protein
MNNSEIQAQLAEVFSVILELEPESVVPQLSPDSCERWDSLRHIQLMSALDETFGIELTFEQQLEAITFELAFEVISEALGAQTGTGA